MLNYNESLKIKKNVSKLMASGRYVLFKLPRYFSRYLNHFPYI